jgi:hypothetical protein
LIETNIGGPLFLATFAALLAGLEWWRYYHPGTPAPRLYSFMAGVVIIYAAFRVYRTLPKLNALKLGRDGEKAVGQFLERFRERGYRLCPLTRFQIERSTSRHPDDRLERAPRLKFERRAHGVTDGQS